LDRIVEAQLDTDAIEITSPSRRIDRAYLA